MGRITVFILWSYGVTPKAVQTHLVQLLRLLAATHKGTAAATNARSQAQSRARAIVAVPVRALLQASAPAVQMMTAVVLIMCTMMEAFLQQFM